MKLITYVFFLLLLRWNLTMINKKENYNSKFLYIRLLKNDKKLRFQMELLDIFYLK